MASWLEAEFLEIGSHRPKNGELTLQFRRSFNLSFEDCVLIRWHLAIQKPHQVVV